VRARDPREARESGGSLQITLNSCRYIYIYIYIYIYRNFLHLHFIESVEQFNLQTLLDREG
jgi:hypothetical protein